MTLYYSNSRHIQSCWKGDTKWNYHYNGYCSSTLEYLPDHITLHGDCKFYDEYGKLIRYNFVANGNIETSTDYYTDGAVKMWRRYHDGDLIYYKGWYRDGTLSCFGSYLHGKRHGDFYNSWKPNFTKSKSTWENGKLQTGETFSYFGDSVSRPDYYREEW